MTPFGNTNSIYLERRGLRGRCNIQKPPPGLPIRFQRLFPIHALSAVGSLYGPSLLSSSCTNPVSPPPRPHELTICPLFLEKEEEEEMELKELDHALLSPYNPTLQTLSISSKYSLSSGAAHSNRRPSHRVSGRSNHKASASSSSSYELCNRSPWQEEIIDADHYNLPSIDPTDHIKTLLSQLASSISAMKGAFAHLQATLRVACNDGSGVITTPAITADKVMVEELQRLSDLHMRLYSVLQEHGAMKQDILNGSPESVCMQEEYVCRNGERPQDGMLKSYEGIISRFYNEMRKKDAVEEALKETLAKSMLKGEKLESRVKFLEAKLSSSCNRNV